MRRSRVGGFLLFEDDIPPLLVATLRLIALSGGSCESDRLVHPWQGGGRFGGILVGLLGVDFFSPILPPRPKEKCVCCGS